MAARRFTHAWDVDQGPSVEGYAPPDLGAAAWDDDDPDRTVSREEAGELFAEMLIRLRLKGTLSAHSCCVLARWAKAAGAAWPCRHFAVPPGQSSGNYQRKMDAYLDLQSTESNFYQLQVPGFSRSEGGRTIHQLEVQPPHERLAEEARANPELSAKLREAMPETEWAENYTEHPVVKASPPGTVLPLALYLDGVPFTKHDGVLAFWVYNLLTFKRHLVAVVRKSEMCQCGCRRWCASRRRRSAGCSTWWPR